MDRYLPALDDFCCLQLLQGTKRIKIYEYNYHDGGGVFQEVSRSGS